MHLLAGFMDTFGTLYPESFDVDLREDAATLDVPVFFVQGAHEGPGRSEPFSQWYAGLSAPPRWSCSPVPVTGRSSSNPPSSWSS